MLKTTKNNKKFWANRKINWTEHYFNPDHPHRAYIIALLKEMKFTSILEAGCGAGANLYRIRSVFPNIEIGGIELNQDAVDECRKRVANAVIEQGQIDNMYFSDKSADIVLTDAALLYYGSWKIKKALKEIDRVARKGILFCELYSPSWFERLMVRFAGYNAHNYPKLLKKMGYHDIRVYKIPKEVWPGGPWEYTGYFILAKK